MKNRIFFGKTTVFNQIFNRIIVRMWTACWARLKKKTLNQLKLRRKHNFDELLKKAFPKIYHRVWK